MSLFTQDEPEIVKSKRLLGGTVGHYHIESQDITSPRDFLDRVKKVVIKFFGDHLLNKTQIRLVCEMERMNPATRLVTNVEQPSFNSEQESMFASTDMKDTYRRMVMKILESFSKYLKSGSGWRLKRVVRLNIRIIKLNPVRGSSCLPLPNSLKARSLINIKNNDQHMSCHEIPSPS